MRPTFAAHYGAVIGKFKEENPRTSSSDDIKFTYALLDEIDLLWDELEKREMQQIAADHKIASLTQQLKIATASVRCAEERIFRQNDKIASLQRKDSPCS